jgi:hypothetical protein
MNLDTLGAVNAQSLNSHQNTGIMHPCFSRDNVAIIPLLLFLNDMNAQPSNRH